MKILKNDKHDVDRGELILIRAGHHLWLDRKKALRASDVALVKAFDAALEDVWAAKRIVRAELKIKRAKAAETLREYFRQRREAKALPLAA